jgi:hypothetical protein
VQREERRIRLVETRPAQAGLQEVHVERTVKIGGEAGSVQGAQVVFGTALRVDPDRQRCALVERADQGRIDHVVERPWSPGACALIAAARNCSSTLVGIGEGGKIE